MPTLKAVLKNDFVKTDGKSNIKIRITHKGRIAYLKTPWNIEPHYMNRDGTLKSTYPGYTTLNKALYAQLTKYNTLLEDIGPSIENMDIKTLASRLKGQGESGADFTEYTKKRIARLKAEKRYSYAESYKVTLTHLERHTGQEKILFKEITSGFIRDFEHYLFLHECSINTIRIYLNNIRAIFNHAIDSDTIKQELFPFRKYKIRQEKTGKRSLEKIQIQKIMTGPYLPAQQRSVDIFMLIFYLIGINLKDLLYLKPEDYRCGRIYYRRHKTKELYSIKVFPPALDLIEKYKGEKYLLSLMDHDDSYLHYKGLLKETNKRLRIATGLKISTYWARHSWATMASSLDVPKDIISVALGHILGSRTTNLYLNFDLHKVDEANEMIINNLMLES